MTERPRGDAEAASLSRVRMRRIGHLPLGFAVLGLAAVLAAGAPAKAQSVSPRGVGVAPTNEIEPEIDDVNDPIEPFNRAMFSFNRGLDKVIIRPVAAIYRTALPDRAQSSVRNFLDNLKSPIIFFNDLLQLNPNRAGTTFMRFLINTTIGVGGLFDPAEDMGYQEHVEDFGQTMAVYGVEEGFYLVLPVLGPSSPRDAVGLLADTYTDPVTYLFDSEVQLTRTGVDGVDLRARTIDPLDELERTSIDFYATMRSGYRQFRAEQIRDGARGRVPSLEEETGFDFEEFEFDNGFYDDAEGEPEADGNLDPSLPEEGAPP